MKSLSRTNLLLAVGCILAALAIAFVWVPLDVQTGVIEKVRRQVSIGDALAPVIAAVFIGLGGVMIFFQDAEPNPSRVSLPNLGFLALLLLLFMVAFSLMRWFGPLVVSVVDLLSTDDLNYRTLRDTPPWKYLGFLLGGTVLITALISSIESRFSIRALAIGFIATCVLIFVYDVPFDDLLLPPNGDV